MKVFVFTLTLVSGWVCALGNMPAFSKSITWYKDIEAKISFAYSEVFTPEEPAQSSTQFLVAWRSPKSNSLLATCYLKRALHRNSLEDAELRERIKNDHLELAQSYLSNSLKAGFDAEIRYSGNTKVGGLDVLYLETHMETESLGKKIDMVIYQVSTFFNKYEVNLFCGTPFYSGKPSLEAMPTSVEFIESIKKEIDRTLRSLTFDFSLLD